ncbi:MAG: 30S ribosomal protein S12 methylthiotransferase RimO [Magnetococcales bacterium]|nr:30S ribosomal protein S12 methylthiotransferase RimO [Magnetococcales bacterium]
MAKRKLRVGLLALGCPKNVVDAERLLGRFLEGGYEPTTDPAQADLLVVNTCGFKADAEAESREVIREMAAIKAAHPGKRLVVTGCLAQRYGERLREEMPAIDVLLGTTGHDRLLELVQAPSPAMPEADFGTASERAPRIITTLPHTAYLKIAEGCGNPCSFCIIPRLRGPFRSRPLDEVVGEARALADGGVRELQVVSQDTTLYGRDLRPRIDLTTLLNRLTTIKKIRWIRLLYLYPTLITDALLDHIAASEKVLPYFDLPLQHAHDAVLQRMQRAERERDLLDLVTRIRARMPEATLRAVFITGFPGESEEEFQCLYDFVAKVRFDHVGVFPYSDEPEAASYQLPGKIPSEMAEERRGRLMALQQTISREKLATLVGRTLPVLVDDDKSGRTRGQALEIDGFTHLQGHIPRPGSIVPVRITRADEYDLHGKVYSTTIHNIS